jgi:hypothetical protein
MPVFARACGEGCKDKPPLWIYTKGTGDYPLSLFDEQKNSSP